MAERNTTRKGLPIERKANRPTSYNKFTVDPPRPKTWLDDDYEQLCYFTSNEFKALCLAVLRIITKAGKRGVSIGEIHRALGDEARPEWTMDAIEHLDEVDGYQRGAMRAYRLKEWTYAAPSSRKMLSRNALIPERQAVDAQPERERLWASLLPGEAMA